jgi:hypothetical protein
VTHRYVFKVKGKIVDVIETNEEITNAQARWEAVDRGADRLEILNSEVSHELVGPEDPSHWT